MKKAIVTGANGFVGKWLLSELSQHEVNVYAVVRNLQSLSDIKSDFIHPVICDLEHLDSLPNYVKDEEIDTFFHLAWAGSTGPQRADENLQLQNVKWTCDAVRVAQKMHVRRFVGAGSLAEFDCNAYISEDGSTPNAVSCYGSAKIAAHYMSKAIACQLGIEHVWAYLSNTYGIGNRTQNFVNFAAQLMLSGKRASFTSGEQTYDFVYASDTAQGLYCAGEHGKNMSSYYIGSGRKLKLKQYIEMIRDSINPEIPLYLGEIPFHGKMQPDEVFDCEKLCNDTGYSPKIPFEKGIRWTVDWIRETEAKA